MYLACCAQLCLAVRESVSCVVTGLEAGAIDTLVMPGLAFDSHNRRLGHGAGYAQQLFSRSVVVCVSPPVVVFYLSGIFLFVVRFYDRFVAKLQTARAERGLPPAFLGTLFLFKKNPFETVFPIYSFSYVRVLCPFTSFCVQLVLRCVLRWFRRYLSRDGHSA